MLIRVAEEDQQQVGEMNRSASPAQRFAVFFYHGVIGPHAVCHVAKANKEDIDIVVMDRVWV